MFSVSAAAWHSQFCTADFHIKQGPQAKLHNHETLPIWTVQHSIRKLHLRDVHITDTGRMLLGLIQSARGERY